MACNHLWITPEGIYTFCQFCKAAYSGPQLQFTVEPIPIPPRQREWWIYAESMDNCIHETPTYNNGHLTHVIEYSYCQQLVNENKKLAKEKQAALVEIAQLKNSRSETTEAIQFWKKSHYDQKVAANGLLDQLTKERDELKDEISLLEKEICAQKMERDAAIEGAGLVEQDLELKSKQADKYFAGWERAQHMYLAEKERAERAEKFWLEVVGIKEELTTLREKSAKLVEAAKQSVARSDDYGDSHCSAPLRQALKDWEGV